MGGRKKKKKGKEKKNKTKQVSKPWYHLTSGMAVRLGPTTDITFLNAFISSQQDSPPPRPAPQGPRWPNRIPTHERGPGTKPLLLLQPSSLGHRAGAGTRMGHTAALESTIQGDLQLENTQLSEEARRQLQGRASSESWEIRQRAPNRVAKTTNHMTLPGWTRWRELGAPCGQPTSPQMLPIVSLWDLTGINKAAPTLCSSASSLINILTLTLHTRDVTSHSRYTWGNRGSESWKLRGWAWKLALQHTAAILS